MANLKVIKSIPRNIQCPHCENIYQLNIDQRKYIGKELICRCGKSFLAQAIDVPKEKIRYVKKFNLLSISELQNDIERTSCPGGITRSEFLDILHDSRVVNEIISAASQKLGKTIDKETVVELIEYHQEMSDI